MRGRRSDIIIFAGGELEGRPSVRVCREDELPLVVEILDILSSNKGITLYDVEGELAKKHIRSSHAVLHGLMKKLVACHHVEVTRREAFRTGLDKKFYDITPSGFYFLFADARTYNGQMDAKRIVSIGSRKRHLHPLFEKLDQWRFSDTPELLKSFLGFYGYRATDSYQSDPQHEEKDKELLADMLIAILFDKELNSLSLPFMPPLGYFFFGEEFPDEVKEKLRQEALIFLQNNPWMLGKIKRNFFSVLDGMEKMVGFLKKEIGPKVIGLTEMSS
jgi:DNA-binding PadR family transcriptional regulator